MQLKEILLIITIFLCLNTIDADLNEDDLNYLENVFQHIPVEQRKYVLLHQIYLGYIQEHPHVTPHDWDISPEETKNIYDLFLNKMKIPTTKEALKGRICLPNGDCIDTDDSGIYPA